MLLIYLQYPSSLRDRDCLLWCRCPFHIRYRTLRFETAELLCFPVTIRGDALKFYASQRIDIRRIGTQKGKNAEGEDVALANRPIVTGKLWTRTLSTK